MLAYPPTLPPQVWNPLQQQQQPQQEQQQQQWENPPQKKQHKEVHVRSLCMHKVPYYVTVCTQAHHADVRAPQNIRTHAHFPPNRSTLPSQTTSCSRTTHCVFGQRKFLTLSMYSCTLFDLDDFGPPLCTPRCCNRCLSQAPAVLHQPKRVLHPLE